MKPSTEFINKWLSKIQPMYLYKSNKIINDKNEAIYVKYSLVSQKTIMNKSNDNDKIIWLLSIKQERPHPRSCKIYKINDNDNMTYLLHSNKKTDIVDFDLNNSRVYLDDNDNIYQLTDTIHSTYYDKDGNKVFGHVIKKININEFTTIIGNIWRPNINFDTNDDKLPELFMEP